MKITIKQGNTSKVIESDKPILLSEAVVLAGAKLDMPCGGTGKCKKCKVKAFGQLSKLDEKEKNALSKSEVSEGIRLACKTTALGDTVITLPTKPKEIILTDFNIPKNKFVSKRENTAIAIDLGTTTIAGYLFDLNNGALLKTSVKTNPQTVFGADVITRIEKSLNGEKEQLALSVRKTLLELYNELSLENTNYAVITGNTAMLYLLTSKDVKTISVSPFVPDCLFDYEEEGKIVGLDSIRSVYFPPCVSAFVGADMVCAALSEDLDKADDIVLLIDIGTNGEMYLKTPTQAFSCSAPAGPAFEGAGITMGMTAQEGAISTVFAKDGRLNFHKIGSVLPKGICGTGIIDAVAALLDIGYLDSSGRILANSENFMIVKGERSIRIGEGIIITQKDIRSIQLAKAAISAAIETLLLRAQIKASNIDRVIIAGGFGSAIHIDSAVKIGLIPNDLRDKAYSVGNAAAAGAAKLLLNTANKTRASIIAKSVQDITLVNDGIFRDIYIKSMNFELNSH